MKIEMTLENLRLVLKSNSSENIPINSVSLFELFGNPEELLHNFRRRLSLTMRELQEEEFSKAVKHEDFLFVLTCNEGAFIASTTKGIAKGIRFYVKKTGRRLLFNAMIYAFKQHLQKEKERRILVEETPANEAGQYELRLAS